MIKNIQWAGPYKLLPTLTARSIFDVPEASGSGIYVWTAPVGNKYRINYVGVANSSIQFRHESHLKCFMTGRYLIHQADSYAAGRRDVLFDPRSGFQNFFERHVELTRALRRQLEIMEIFYSPVKQQKEMLERLESAIYTHLKSQKGQCAEFLDNLRRSRIDFSEEHMAVVSASCTLFEGWM